MKPANKVLSGYGTTIFTVMSQMAVEHDAINLGQGFPDVDGPEDIRKVASDSLLADSNQYPPMMGIAELRQAVADHNKRFYGLDIDWNTEVMITSGATEALADCILGLIEPGDEVVLIEPLYDCYLPLVRRAGGIPRLVRVEPPHWHLDRDSLSAAFSDKTKLLILNNPMNPSAKVFTEEELSFLAGLVEKYDAYALCDEVYEHLVYDGRSHIPLMTLPGMRDRCIRIGSAGKTFSLTGWKIGYVTAPAHILQPIAKAHQFVTFTTPPNLQKAVAYGLNKEDKYYLDFQEGMQRQRDLLSRGLRDLGWDIRESHGTYFLSADITPFSKGEDDVAFCTRLTQQVGVAAVPISAFYGSDAPRNFIRFCFCKRDEVILKALDRLKRLSKPC